MVFAPSGRQSIIWTIILFLVLLFGCFFAARVFMIYDHIVEEGVVGGDLDFSDQMSIGLLVSEIKPDVDRMLVENNDDPALGSNEPVLTIVEFGDFQCPHCAELNDTVRRLATLYGEKVRFVYRDFPVADIHPDAQLAAEAAACADEQDMFWQYSDKLFVSQSDLSVTALQNYAAQTGLKIDQFEDCLATSRQRGEVLDDYADGVLAGVYGTPTFFFNGSRVAGAIPADIFEEIIIGFLK